MTWIARQVVSKWTVGAAVRASPVGLPLPTSATGLGAGRRSAGQGERPEREAGDEGVPQVDPFVRGQDEIGLGDGRSRNGRCAREEIDRSIEIVVVPVAAEPGGVWRVGVSDGSEHAQ